MRKPSLKPPSILNDPLHAAKSAAAAAASAAKGASTAAMDVSSNVSRTIRHTFDMDDDKLEEKKRVPSIYQGNADCRNSRGSKVANTASQLLRSSTKGNLALDQRRASVEAREKESFKAQVIAVRQKFAKMRRTTINPLSKQLLYWDGVTSMALLFTAFVTPFEIGFISDESAGPVLFTFNRLVDTIFFMDMCATFFLPFRATALKGGMWVYDNKKIVLNYLSSWFLLDVLTTVPFDLIFKAFTGGGSDSSTVRVVRLLRVLKLARILRASRILKRWEDHMSFSYAMLSLAQFFFITVIMSHWLACWWGYIGGAADHILADHSHYTDNLTIQRLHEINLELDDYSQSNWIKLARAWTDNYWDLYALSIYVALNNIFGGSCDIAPGNFSEFYVQALMLLVGSGVWAYIIGAICGIISTMNPVLVEFRQTMDELNYFAKDQGIPKDLAVRLRGFFRNSSHLIRAKKYDDLLSRMSTSLWGETSYAVAKRTLRTVYYLAHPDLEPEFLLSISIRFKLMVFSRLEAIPVVNLSVLQCGVAARNGHILLTGTPTLTTCCESSAKHTSTPQLLDAVTRACVCVPLRVPRRRRPWHGYAAAQRPAERPERCDRSHIRSGPDAEIR